jgi:opacity protein-like surface antigen
VLLAFVVPPPDSGAAESSISIAHELDARWSFVGNAATRGDGARFDSGDQQSGYLRYVLSPQVTSRLLLHFGAEWQRFSFDVPDFAPLPDRLQQISAVLGLDFQLNDQWLIRAELQPGVYSDFDDVSWMDVNSPLLLSAAYLVNPDLQWIFGLRIDPRSHYPIIPAAGVRWKFADEWTLSAILPQPRLEYDLNERFQIHLGADIEAGSFRMSNDFGTDEGRPELDRELLDYFSVRVGPGFSWNIRPNITVEASAGYMVYRRFEFADEDLTLRSDPAPYVQIACQLRF